MIKVIYPGRCCYYTQPVKLTGFENSSRAVNGLRRRFGLKGFLKKEVRVMAENNISAPIPSGQAWYDNILLLLVVGIVLPTIIYTAWGLIEIMNVPPLPLAP